MGPVMSCFLSSSSSLACLFSSFPCPSTPLFFPFFPRLYSTLHPFHRPIPIYDPFLFHSFPFLFLSSASFPFFIFPFSVDFRFRLYSFPVSALPSLYYLHPLSLRSHLASFPKTSFVPFISFSLSLFSIFLPLFVLFFLIFFFSLMLFFSLSSFILSFIFISLLSQHFLSPLVMLYLPLQSVSHKITLLAVAGEYDKLTSIYSRGVTGRREGGSLFCPSRRAHSCIMSLSLKCVG